MCSGTALDFGRHHHHTRLETCGLHPLTPWQKRHNGLMQRRGHGELEVEVSRARIRRLCTLELRNQLLARRRGQHLIVHHHARRLLVPARKPPAWRIAAMAGAAGVQRPCFATARVGLPPQPLGDCPGLIQLGALVALVDAVVVSTGSPARTRVSS